MSSKIDPTDYGHCPKCKSVIHFDERLKAGQGEPVEVVQADNAEQALTLLDFALSFALCNMDHAGTRRDVKKAQLHLESYRKFLASQPATASKQEAATLIASYLVAGRSEGHVAEVARAIIALASTTDNLF